MATIGEWIESVGSTISEYTKIKSASQRALTKKIAANDKETKIEKILKRLDIDLWDVRDHFNWFDHSAKIQELKTEVRRLEKEQVAAKAYHEALKEGKAAEIELRAALDIETAYDNRPIIGG